MAKTITNSLCLRSFNPFKSHPIASLYSYPCRNPLFSKAYVLNTKLKGLKVPPFGPVIRAQNSPDVMFCKVEAIIRPWRVPRVSCLVRKSFVFHRLFLHVRVQGLLKIGFRGMTDLMFEDLGFKEGPQNGITVQHSPAQRPQELLQQQHQLQHDDLEHFGDIGTLDDHVESFFAK